eukprot:TRINITY_DN5295_c0_g1_i1.p1 TRINITY_DN5295_c0_g1~~TRINITY_DN5295_c0_g1_i1.p1  ORF type:complete len:924 (+),score=181.32 TRINITY_DN5295_c0_g1_i1:44-2815(+)
MLRPIPQLWAAGIPPAPTRAPPSQLAREVERWPNSGDDRCGTAGHALVSLALTGFFACSRSTRRRRQRQVKHLLRRVACRSVAGSAQASPKALDTQDKLSSHTDQNLPWLQRHLPDGDRELNTKDSHNLLLCFMDAIDERGVELYPAQEEAVAEIFSGSHVVLDTPTGSGKSLVAVAALFKALAEGGKAYYTSPTKALTSEKFFDLCRHFGPADVGMATGDVSLNPRARLVCCTAEVLASIALRDGADSNISMVVMDEFHYFGSERGAAWELPLWRLSRPGGPTAFLLMSGTLGSNATLYRTLEEKSGRPVRVVSSSDRPVPLHFAYNDGSVRSSIEQLVRTGRFPVYAVHFSQRDALQTAKELADAEAADGSGKLLAPALDQRGRREELRQAVGDADFASPFGSELRNLLLRGVGVHHAGLLPRYRRLVEQLTQRGLLPLVCGTDTLGVGVNVPIRSVLFTKLCKFDGEEIRLVESREFHQIAGRAGRRGFDTSGDVVAVDPDWVVHNRQLQEQLQSPRSGEPRPLPHWRRPPRRNYKHWDERTFEKLQRSAPASLRSQFQLTMGQVFSVLEGARVRGCDGEAELEDLLSSAQCSRGMRRFWRRQVKAFLRAANVQGTSMEETPHVEEQPSYQPSDDATLFVNQVLVVLQESVCEEDLPLALLVAAESVCDAPVTLLRAMSSVPRDSETGLRPGTCPDVLEAILFEVFTLFREQRPWVPAGLLRPKGIAFDLVSRKLSFAQLAEHLGGAESAAVTSEGNLLRYLADVYRTLRLCASSAAKGPGVKALEVQLRSAILEVDSSLIQEWEALKRVQEQEAARQPAAIEALVSETGTGSSSGEKEQKLVGGAMVPAAAGTSVPRRSQQEQSDRARAIRRRLDKQHLLREEAAIARSKRPSRRLLVFVDKVLDKILDVWDAAVSLVW